MTIIDMNALSSASRLALSDEEKQAFAADVEKILSLAEHLPRVDSHTPDPIAEAASVAALRPDLPAQSLPREAILAIAPSFADAFVTVPRVLGDSPEKEVKP